MLHKNKAWQVGGRVVSLKRVLQGQTEMSADKLTFERCLKKVRENGMPGRGHSKCKGPEVRGSLDYFKKSRRLMQPELGCE